MPTKPLYLLGREIHRGRTTLTMDIARLHTRTKIEVPVIVEQGKKPYPVILFTAGIHGNEVNGIEIIRQLIAGGYNKPETGTIICIPVVNVFGFLNQSREFPDGRDLNRLFPGSPTGSLASRFAYHIMHEIVPQVDYFVDFHTGGASRYNFPQVRVDFKDHESLKLAKIFRTRYILNSETRDKSFRETLSKAGKRVLLYEGGKSLHLDDKITSQGIEGSIRLLHYLQFHDFSDQISAYETSPDPVLISSSAWIRSNHSGMYRRMVDNGSRVKKGQKLGSISDPYGDFEKHVKAPRDGFVLASNHAPIVTQGDALILLGSLG